MGLYRPTYRDKVTKEPRECAEHLVETPAVLVIERHRDGQVRARIARAGALGELAPHGLVLFTLEKTTPRRRFRQPMRPHLETSIAVWVFGERRMAHLIPAHVATYVVTRLDAGASNWNGAT